MSIIIRDLIYTDIPHFVETVRAEWGDDAAERAVYQTSPQAFIPDNNFFYTAERGGELLGFAGMRKSWLMRDAWEFIWVAVKAPVRGTGIGRELTLHRIAEVRRRGGSLIFLVTQKPRFFRKFGFRESHEDFDGWHLMVQQINRVRI